MKYAMMKKILYVVLLFAVFSVSAMGQNATECKLKADSAYVNEDYASAIKLYENLLKSGEAAEIYYNLGNCYYKTKDIARAILNYERALLLRPDNADIRANLEIARSKTVDKINMIPEIFFISWTKSLINSFSIDSWAKIAVISFWLFLLFTCLFLVSKQSKWKKTGFFAGIIFMILSISSNIFANAQKNNLLNRHEAIILAPSVTVRSTPSENGTSLFILHEGRKVKVKDNSMRDWKEIILEDGKVGWLATSTIEFI